ncbi:MAG: hypothetical protein Q8O26_02400 [Phreatobacter sp.]|uniref:hypothetical protein n=1 Tax=Phreatobacter sp. TaxID=1966341 RepID=UPI0027337DAF|nr:hypothetical protein [Phreatobacter sp.]MDP2800711.1 hypothetical protein [Phreatobacter sp.]
MRHLRLALALVLALALSADGMLSQAAMAHRLAVGSLEGMLCSPERDRPAPAPHAACDDHCLGAPPPDGDHVSLAGAPVAAHGPAERGQKAVRAFRITSPLSFDHAARAPPAAA